MNTAFRQMQLHKGRDSLRKHPPSGEEQGQTDVFAGEGGEDLNSRHQNKELSQPPYIVNLIHESKNQPNNPLNIDKGIYSESSHCHSMKYQICRLVN